jgi:glyoxylase-like metal-dependent hydrolase (beta-lactamase superfamily II)/rhodanese-related sulfurtransferase
MEDTITVKELQEKLNKHENVFILDVRPDDQRKEWKIANSVHVNAYKQLNAGDDTALDIVDLPHDSTVVTVCAAGRTSLLASKLLQRKGVQAYSLDGGMKAWNYAWNIAHIVVEGVQVIQVRRAAKGVLSYVVGSKNEAVVIDAALDPIVYQGIAEDNGWKIKFVIDTHVHADYVSRTRDLSRATGARHLMIDKAKVEFPYVGVANGEMVKFGDAALEVVHTPGHTWESTTFKLGDSAIFTGDTLFTDSVGRPDLKADAAEGIEKAKALYKSLKQLLSLNGDTIVLPAHTSSTIGFDGKLIGEAIKTVGSRVSLIQLSEPEFVEYTASKLPPTPPNYLTIAAINRTGTYDGQVLADLEAGGNHCAIAWLDTNGKEIL